MDKTPLITIFRSLSNQEVRELGRLLESPYFNRREEVSRLFAFIKASLELPEGALSKQKAFNKVFPNEVYEDSRMRYTMSFLLQLIKRYFVLQEVEKDEVQNRVLLCRALRSRNLGPQFEKELTRTIHLQEKQAYRNTRFHYNNYLIHFEQYEYISQQRRRGDMPLQQLSDELSIFFIADILRQSCTILTHQTVAKRDYDLKLLDAVLAHVEAGEYAEVPAVTIYYHSYRALSGLSNEQDFVQLTGLIEKYWHCFPTGESRDIYLLAINYCIKRLNSGALTYIRRGFELYQSGLRNGVFLENGTLSDHTYKNVTRLGMALEEFDWVEQFLNHYKKFLHPQKRENTYLYNLASFYFQKPDYAQSMRLLQQVDFKDVLNNLDSRRMLLRMYYELGEYEALGSHLDSFQTYISRQKDIGYHRDNYLALIRIVRKLLRSNLQDRSTRLRIRKLVENTNPLAEKNWLLEQLDA